MRQGAREREELELEREDERVERRPAPPACWLALVERVEEPRQREERTVALLLLREEPQHRLQPDEADLEPVAVGAVPVVRSDERRAGDRAELAAAPVERELNVRQRLEPPAEPALRPPDALGDRAEPAARRRVDVEHAVGLAEGEGAEHHGLGDRRRGHSSSVRAAAVSVLARGQNHVPRPPTTVRSIALPQRSHGSPRRP